MFKVYKTEMTDIDEVVSLIEKLNSNAKNNIGYCAKKKEEIEHALREDFYNNGAEGVIYAAIEDGKIVGVLGCDCDFEEESGEVWGPFIDIKIDEESNKVASRLWNELRRGTKGIKEYGMFINSENAGAIEFAKGTGAVLKSEQEILVLNRADFKGNHYEDMKELKEEDYENFIKLHEDVFKDTYLNGKKIISRVNSFRKIFVKKENDKVLGYIYIEVEEEFCEATVEFLAVDKECRNKGIGYRLLNKGLEWIFSFKCIEHIKLCATSSNKVAINLYKKNGFKTEAELKWFKLMI